jgi:hypothetical protein
MKAFSNTRRSTSLEPNENMLVIQLERNLMDVDQLRNKLNSYSCEPQTYSHFERIESLKNGLESFKKTNKDIINSLRGHKESVKGYMEKVKEQYANFNELRQGVEEYLGLVQSRYAH